MKRTIIESPFAGNVERNLRYLRACIRDCLLRGEAPFASHAIYTQPGVLDDTKPDERQMGINAGFAWRRDAEITAVYTDLGITNGMRAGIAHAELRVGAGRDRHSWEPPHELVYRTLPNFEALMADFYDVDLEGPSGSTQTIYKVPVGTLERWREQGMKTSLGLMQVVQAKPSPVQTGEPQGVKE